MPEDFYRQQRYQFLNKVAEDIVNHYFNQDGDWKSLVVCIDKKTTVKMWNKVNAEKGKLKIFLIILLVTISIVTWYFSYQSGLTTIYNDAMGHLNIARAVIDGKQPGLAQLGSVWLPLDHILFLALIWNTWAWHSGFAGSFF